MTSSDTQGTELSGSPRRRSGLLQPSLREQGSRQDQPAFRGGTPRYRSLRIGRSPGAQKSACLNGRILCADHSLGEEDEHRRHCAEPEIHSTIRPLAPFPEAGQIAALVLAQCGEG